MSRLKFLILCLAAAGANAALAELPPLIPRETLFGNPARSHPEISPDGSQTRVAGAG